MELNFFFRALSAIPMVYGECNTTFQPWLLERKHFASSQDLLLQRIIVLHRFRRGRWREQVYSRAAVHTFRCRKAYRVEVYRAGPPLVDYVQLTASISQGRSREQQTYRSNHAIGALGSLLIIVLPLPVSMFSLPPGPGRDALRPAPVPGPNSDHAPNRVQGQRGTLVLQRICVAFNFDGCHSASFLDDAALRDGLPSDPDTSVVRVLVPSLDVVTGETFGRVMSGANACGR